MAEPVRTCVGCRERAEQRALVRLVVDAAGRVRIDVPRRQPGRGAYVHPAVACVRGLVERQGIAKSLKRRVEQLSEDELWARLEAALLADGSEAGDRKT